MLTATGTFATGTGSNGTTIAITTNFQPVAVILWMSGGTTNSDHVTRQNYVFSFGAAVSTSSRRCVAAQSVDNNSGASSDSAHRDDACICALDTSGAVVGLMDLQSMDANGFTLVVDDAFPSSYIVQYLAIGGSDVTNAALVTFQEAGATGNQDITTVGFQPDFAMFMSACLSTAPQFAANDSTISLGAAVSSVEQFVTYSGSNDAAATTNTRQYNYGSECIALPTAAAAGPNGRAAFDSFLSNGFRLNWVERTSTRYIFALCLQGGSYDIQKGTTGAQDAQIEINTGFETSAGMVFGTMNPESTVDNSSAPSQLTIGAFTSATNRSASGISDQNNVTTTRTYTMLEVDSVYINMSSSTGAIGGLMDVLSIDADGHTFVMDDGDTGVTFYSVSFGPRSPFALAMSGGITPTGTLVRSANLSLSGGITPAGAISHIANKLCAGSVGIAGALIRNVNAVYSGSLTPVGALVRNVAALYGGSITPAGTLVRIINTAYDGSLTPTGVMTALIATAYSGVITPTGAVTKQVVKLFGGVTALTGALTKTIIKLMTGDLTPSGEMVTLKVVVLDVAGELEPAGALRMVVDKMLSGDVTPAGSLARIVNKLYAGQVAPQGTVSKLLSTSLQGDITPAGQLTTVFAIAMSGLLGLSGNLQKSTHVNISGVVTPIGTLVKSVFITTSGQLTPAGTAYKLIVRTFSGVISFAGNLSTTIIPFVPGSAQVVAMFKGMFKGMFRRM